jgi:protein phosphatase
VTLLVLGLRAVGAGAGWAYVRSQYYVGVDGEQVAIFRGVTGEVGPVRFSQVEQRTELATERLDPIAANRVEQGIVAADRAEAEAIVDRLRARFPECTDAAPVPTPLPTAVPTLAATAAALPSAAATAPSAPTAPAVPAAPTAEPPCPAGSS